MKQLANFMFLVKAQSCKNELEAYSARLKQIERMIQEQKAFPNEEYTMYIGTSIDSFTVREEDALWEYEGRPDMEQKA